MRKRNRHLKSRVVVSEDKSTAIDRDRHEIVAHHLAEMIREYVDGRLPQPTLRRIHFPLLQAMQARSCSQDRKEIVSEKNNGSRELFPNKSAAANVKRELFPTKKTQQPPPLRCFRRCRRNSRSVRKPPRCGICNRRDEAE